jgi:hypothetical protein
MPRNTAIVGQMLCASNRLPARSCACRDRDRYFAIAGMAEQSTPAAAAESDTCLAARGTSHPDDTCGIQPPPDHQSI